MRLRDKAASIFRDTTVDLWRFIRWESLSRSWHWYLLYLCLGVVGSAPLIHIAWIDRPGIGSQEKVEVADVAGIPRSDIFVRDCIELEKHHFVFTENSP